MPPFENPQAYIRLESILYFNETEEKTYIFEAKKGCYPACHEFDPFEDLEERKVKKTEKK